MNRGVALIIFFGLLHFVACKKDSSLRFDFSEITNTDSNCAMSGEVDSTDWTYDSGWTNMEYNLLKYKDTLITTDSVEGYVEVSPLCNNPSNGFYVLGVNTERACKLKMICVNTDWEILYFYTTILTGGVGTTVIDFRGMSSFKPGENYRLYYAFYTSKGVMYYKGHGDLRIE